MASSSSSLTSSFAAIRRSPSFTCQTRQALHVIRAQCFRDEGSGSDNVDANLSVLRKRVEEVKMKEKLERCGWNYAPGYKDQLKRDADKLRFCELVTLVARTVGLTFLVGTIFLCLVSLLVHLN